MTKVITFDEMMEAMRQDNSIDYLLKFGDINFVREAIEGIDRNVLRNYLLGKLGDYLGNKKEDVEKAFKEIWKGQMDINLVKRLLNLGMVTIAYKALLRDKEPEKIIVDYNYMFENRSEELELIIRNHIITKELFDNAGDMGCNARIKTRLESLRAKSKENFRETMDRIISKFDDYCSFAQQNHMQNGIELGHHQLLPAFLLREEDALLLKYATGGGKTYAAMLAAKDLLQRNPGAKILLISPLQAIQEGTWNEEGFYSFGIDKEVMVVENGCRINNPSILIVNYDKLPESRSYFEEVRKFADKSDLVIMDEVHNIKNPNGKISRNVQKLITLNNPKRLGLTATPHYNNERDIGSALYVCDPARWRNYGNCDDGNGEKDDPGCKKKSEKVIFSYSNKAGIISLIEMIEKHWLEFDREHVKAFHNLPELHTDISFVDIKDEDKEKYMKIYTDILLSEEQGRSLAKAAELEKESILSLVNSDHFLEQIKAYSELGYVVNIFSRLKTGIFDVLEERLGGIIDKSRIRTIEGFVDYSDRIRIQQELKEGKVDALINQWDCTGEAFAETAGKRPILIVPLICPFSPGKLEQIIGRSYRPGQEGNVELLLMFPNSTGLKERIRAHVDDLIKQRGITRKLSWEPTTLHEDAWDMCYKKGNNFDAVSQLRKVPNSNVEDITSLEDWANYIRNNFQRLGVFEQRRVLFTKGMASDFGRLVSLALNYMGMEYDPENLEDNLIKAYKIPNVLLMKPGEINLALSAIISTLKDPGKKWIIGDYGCCTGVFSQSMFIANTIKNIIHNDETIDKIINIDGSKSAIDYGRKCAQEGLWVEYVRGLSNMKPEVVEALYERIKDPAYYQRFLNNRKYIHGNFVMPQVRDGILDCAVISQAIHYNNQEENRDIERIVLNINKALKEGGYLVMCLVGSHGKKSITKNSDITNIRHLLERYGFRIEQEGELKDEFHIEGLSLTKVKKPPYHVVARKIEESRGLIKKGYEEFVIYTGEYNIITGVEVKK